jgi:hypothetical protein
MAARVLAWMVTSGLALSSAGYVRVAEDKGVTVYRREGARAIELAAEGNIAAPPQKVRDVLIDYAHHPAWVNHLAESRVLERQADSLVVYQRLDLPLIDDRDFTLHVTWGSDARGVLWTRFSTANDLGPEPRHGVVRVALHEGGWQLEPIEGGRATHARYFLRLDLAGSLPAWMSRSRAGKDIPGLFESIRKQLK